MKSSRELEDAAIRDSDGWYRKVRLRRQNSVNYGVELYRVKQTQNIGPGSYSYNVPNASPSVAKIGELYRMPRAPSTPSSNYYSPSNSLTSISGPRDIVFRLPV